MYLGGLCVGRSGLYFLVGRYLPEVRLEGHFENAILSEFNICSFLLRASNVDDLDHLEKFLAFVMSTLHSIAAVSSSVSSNLAKWTMFRISSTQRARSMPTLFQLCLPVFFGHYSSHCSASASPTLTWQSHSEVLPRSMSGECFGCACAVLPVPQVASSPTSFQFWCL